MHESDFMDVIDTFHHSIGSKSIKKLDPRKIFWPRLYRLPVPR